MPIKKLSQLKKLQHPYKRVRLLSEILELKIGDLTDRIIDEIIYDLTPYGYKPIGNVNSGSNNEQHNKHTYVRIENYSNADIDKYICNDLQVVYSHEVVADIMLNRHDKISRDVTREVEKVMPGNVLRDIATSEKYYNRRMEILKRKTISRNSKKIIKIIMENNFDMRIQEDETFDMSIKHDEIEEYIK